MSVECSECERDLRGGHDPSCSRHPDNRPPPQPAASDAQPEPSAGGPWRAWVNNADGLVSVRGDPGPGAEIRSLQGMCDLANALEQQLAEQRRRAERAEAERDRQQWERQQLAIRAAQEGNELEDQLTAARTALREKQRWIHNRIAGWDGHTGPFKDCEACRAALAETGGDSDGGRA